MKEIKLTQDQIALVDDEDFESLNKYKWQAQKGATTYYSVRTDYSNGKANSRLLYMHCELLGISQLNGVKGDHIDRNGLNNQRSNLRLATHSENMANRRSFKNSSSKYLGVGWHKATGKWSSYIRKNDKQKHLGLFDTQEEAAQAYNVAAKEIHKEFANLNIIPLLL